MFRSLVRLLVETAMHPVIERIAVRRGLALKQCETSEELLARIRVFEQTRHVCVVGAARVAGVEPAISPDGDEPLCDACASVVRAYRAGRVSEGRASQMLDINRLQLRFLADAQQMREEEPS